MDASRLKMIHCVLVVQSALLVGVMTMLARALLMVGCVNIRAGAVLGEVLLVLCMESFALALMLSVEGVMRGGMPGVHLLERTVWSAIALVFSRA